MVARKQLEVHVLCPNCDASGKARVTQIDVPGGPDPAFRVDAYPAGFSEAKPSALLHETGIKCDCGHEFHLL
jgi:hypothetical protein